MPLYEYKCDSCGYLFETRQGFNDEALTTCPNCGKVTIHRVIQPASIVFKGSGFYVTDHKGNKAATKNAKKEEGDTVAPAADKTDKTDKVAASTTEAKPASAGESKATDSTAAPSPSSTAAAS